MKNTWSSSATTSLSNHYWRRYVYSSNCSSLKLDNLHTRRQQQTKTRSSPIAEGPRDASCQLKSCQLPRNSAETTCATSTEPGISVLFCSLAVLDPRVGHIMDVLSPFIPVLCYSDWLFHGESCPRLDVVHPGRAWPSSPSCTWHCSLHCLFLQTTPLFPHGVTVVRYRHRTGSLGHRVNGSFGSSFS